MTKQEIYDKIVEICATVCQVTVDNIKSGSRKEAVVTARSLVIFWCDAAGLSVESLRALTNSRSASSINYAKSKITGFWRERFAYRLLAIEVGKRLQEHALEIGAEFDLWKPINKMDRKAK